MKKYTNRSAGLVAAVRAVGSYGALAKGLGITKAAVWQWKKIPAERVVAVESLSGVPRQSLRPDLYL